MRAVSLRSGLFVGLFAAGALSLAVAGTAAAQSGDNQDRHVRIINETSHTLTKFYASNTAVNDWQEDILGRDVLRSGKEVRINIDDGTGHCLYDFKAVFDNGATKIDRNINVCKIGFYRYSD